jgi:hypothetical protein
MWLGRNNRKKLQNRKQGEKLLHVPVADPAPQHRHVGVEFLCRYSISLIQPKTNLRCYFNYRFTFPGGCPPRPVYLHPGDKGQRG